MPRPLVESMRAAAGSMLAISMPSASRYNTGLDPTFVPEAFDKQVPLPPGLGSSIGGGPPTGGNPDEASPPVSEPEPNDPDEAESDGDQPDASNR